MNRSFCFVFCFVVVGSFVGCDARPTLAQFAVFSGYREELADQCCQCLAKRGTGAADATCSEPTLVDNTLVFEDGAVFGSGNTNDDFDDKVQAGEIPCACGLDNQGCTDALVGGNEIVIPGACVDQPDATAPCETECAGILNYSGISG